LSTRRQFNDGAGLNTPGLVLAVLLGTAAVGSAVGAIYVKYLTRTEFGVLQQVRAERDALDVEWGRLQIEEAALTSHTRIEENARTKLEMYMPEAGEVRVVEVIMPERGDSAGQSHVR
jgi:cell division protein FtsL